MAGARRWERRLLPRLQRQRLPRNAISSPRYSLAEIRRGRTRVPLTNQSGIAREGQDDRAARSLSHVVGNARQTPWEGKAVANANWKRRSRACCRISAVGACHCLRPAATAPSYDVHRGGRPFDERRRWPFLRGLGGSSARWRLAEAQRTRLPGGYESEILGFGLLGDQRSGWSRRGQHPPSEVQHGLRLANLHAHCRSPDRHGARWQRSVLPNHRAGRHGVPLVDGGDASWNRDTSARPSVHARSRCYFGHRPLHRYRCAAVHSDLCRY